MSGRARVALALVVIATLPLAAEAVGDVVEGGDVSVSFDGWVAPRRLPRAAPEPISLHVGGQVHPVEGRKPAALRTVEIEVNRHAVVSLDGIPPCPARRLRGLRSDEALALCPRSLVGVGHFSARVEIPEGAPFPSHGRLLAFASSLHGRPALVAHIFGVVPVPTAQVLPIRLRSGGHGAFGTTMTFAMPSVGPEWGYVTGFDVTFSRGTSFLAASCPAPKGIVEAPFTAARGRFHLADGRVLTRTVEDSCRAAR